MNTDTGEIYEGPKKQDNDVELEADLAKALLMYPEKARPELLRGVNKGRLTFKPGHPEDGFIESYSEQDEWNKAKPLPKNHSKRRRILRQISRQSRKNNRNSR